MDVKSVMTAVRLASQRDAVVTAKAEAAAMLAGSNTAGISFKQSNVASNYAYDVAYANGLWLAGMYNAAYYSYDGKTWTQIADVDYSLSGFTYANGLWVAGGLGTIQGLFYSEDGINWERSNITNQKIRKTAYANGVWVASGPSAGLYYSEDGKNWTKCDSVNGTFDCIVYANNLWVAGGSFIYYSADGKTWTRHNTMGNVKDLVYADGIWVGCMGVVSMSGWINGLFRSSDGQNWTQLDSGSFTAIAHANGMWVAAGVKSTTNSRGLLYSYDAQTWEKTNITSCVFYSISYGDGVWVAAAGSKSEIGGLCYSLDGKVWMPSDISTGSFLCATYADGMWVVASDSGEGGKTGLYYGQIINKYTTPDKLVESVNAALQAAGEFGGLAGPKGDKGDPGETGPAGKDGVSVTHAWDGTTLSVTSASGTTSANLQGPAGPKGDTGSAGATGADGVSPTVTVSKSGKVTTVTIKDATGAKTATINDGADGSSVPPDWAKNDENADGYIKNRTHYVIPITVLKGYSDISAEGSFDGSRCIRIGKAFDATKLIGATISYNGVKTILTADNIHKMSGNDSTNVAVVVSSPQSKDMPGLFVINGAPTNGTFPTDTGARTYHFGSTGLYRLDGFYTVPSALEIEYGGGIVQLDEKYIPETLQRTGENVDIPTGKTLILASTTPGSTKKFKITVDDEGTLKAEEITT